VHPSDNSNFTLPSSPWLKSGFLLKTIDAGNASLQNWGWCWEAASKESAESPVDRETGAADVPPMTPSSHN
jgi:hypothetical protein